MTELVFILDRSGSMSGLERDTIGGFNSMIRKQKGEPGDCLVSTLLFDHETAVIHDRMPLDKVPDLTEKESCTRGSTASSTNMPARRTGRRAPSSSLPPTAWKTPAGTMIMKR